MNYTWEPIGCLDHRHHQQARTPVGRLRAQQKHAPYYLATINSLIVGQDYRTIAEAKAAAEAAADAIAKASTRPVINEAPGPANNNTSPVNHRKRVSSGISGTLTLRRTASR